MIYTRKNLVTSLLALGLVSTASFATTNDPNNTLNPTQVKQVKEIVHDYLVTSPEVLIEASQSLQKQQMAKAEKEAMVSIKTHFKELTHDPISPVLGNPDGNVVLVEFSDYQCGHCKSMSSPVSELIKNNKDLRVVIKELPIFGPTSEFASRAAIAATKQGAPKFLAFHKALFATETRLNDKLVLDIAKNVGLNVDQLKKDMDTAPIKAELKNNIKLAQALKLAGTPAFVVANKNGSGVSFVPGVVREPVKQFQLMIEKARKAS